jgi:hypothetical protein
MKEYITVSRTNGGDNGKRTTPSLLPIQETSRKRIMSRKSKMCQAIKRHNLITSSAVRVAIENPVLDRFIGKMTKIHKETDNQCLTVRVQASLQDETLPTRCTVRQRANTLYSTSSQSMTGNTSKARDISNNTVSSTDDDGLGDESERNEEKKHNDNEEYARNCDV